MLDSADPGTGVASPEGGYDVDDAQEGVRGLESGAEEGGGGGRRRAFTAAGWRRYSAVEEEEVDGEGEGGWGI